MEYEGKERAEDCDEGKAGEPEDQGSNYSSPRASPDPTALLMLKKGD